MSIGEPLFRIDPRADGTVTSATLAVQERCTDLSREGRTVYRLGLGQSPFPVPLVVVEALRANASHKQYLPVRGLPALREAVARYHGRRHGVQRAPESVLVGPGSKELLFLLQLVFDGDIIVPTPAWVSYVPQARIATRRVVALPMRAEDHWRVDPERLDALCAASDRKVPRLLLLNYPANPTGTSYDIDHLVTLARVARERDIVILSDEIYGELRFDGGHVSIGRMCPERTIVSSGLSKWCGAGGWRLGTFSFPPELGPVRDAMAVLASETFTSTSAPIQYAAVRAFQGGPEIEKYLAGARRLLSALTAHCLRALTAAGARTEAPDGAFYLFSDFGGLREPLAARGIRTSEELAARLLEETGVAVLPGTDFGRAPDELSVRLAVVDFDGAKALEAIQVLPDGDELSEVTVRSLCANVTDGVDRMAEWARAR